MVHIERRIASLLRSCPLLSRRACMSIDPQVCSVQSDGTRRTTSCSSLFEQALVNKVCLDPLARQPH
jgi:hypothetical protein